MRKQRLSIAAFGLVAALASAPAGGQGSATSAVAGQFMHHGGALVPVPQDVPIEVRRVVPAVHGIDVYMINASAHTIDYYEVAVLRPGAVGHLQATAAMFSQTPLAWAPATERIETIGQRLAADVLVVPLAALTSDGAGFGVGTGIERVRRDARGRQDGLVAVSDLLREARADMHDDDLQALIDRIALAMARAPVVGRGEASLAPYTSAIAGLKRLQGRGMGGTPRFARELQQLQSTVARELEGVRRSPALQGSMP